MQCSRAIKTKGRADGRALLRPKSPKKPGIGDAFWEIIE